MTSYEKPTEVKTRDWKTVALRVKDDLATDQVSLIAGGIAFYGLLALFPMITALVAIGGIIFEPEALLGVSETLTGLMPGDAANIITGQMEEVVSSGEAGLGLAAVVGVLLALYSATKGIDNMIRGLNVAYGVTEERGFLQLKMTVFALTLAFLAGLLLAVGIMVALPVALRFLDGLPILQSALVWLRWPILLLIGFGGILILYRYGPSADVARWRWLAPGALMATLLWVAGTAGFAIYVRMFGSYNETFGALAGVVILLMWLWISSFVILLGAEIDAELDDAVDTS